MRTRTLLYAAAFLLLAPRAGIAQDFGRSAGEMRRTPLPDFAKLIAAEQARPVRLTLVDGTTMSGNVGEPDAQNFTLVMGGDALMGARVGVAWNRISEVRIERKQGLLKGMLMGTAAGAAVGALSPEEGDTDRTRWGLTAPERVWDAALQGAVAGALSGLLEGIDVVLQHTPQQFGLTGTTVPSQRPVRPSNRLVQTAPGAGLVLGDMEASLRTNAAFTGAEPVRVEDTWNGRAGGTLAWETGWPLDPSWWVRTRLEWTRLPRMSLRNSAGYGILEVWHEYQAWRSWVGLSRPFGAVHRLPFLEISFLAGLGREQFRSGATAGPSITLPEGYVRSQRQVALRPLLMVSADVALLRRPSFAVAFRAEGVMGPGFRTNALFSPSGTLLLDRYRITPIGLNFGLVVLFPNF